ncbi:transposable element Tcb1 transposase [Trichonephila clavipes]|nr:transposable element Tcb1 transposase [Trichonephila clavipes]
MTMQCKSRFGKSVNPETVRNVLRKDKYRGRVAQKSPTANRQARLAFSKMYVRQPKYSENVIFDDESKYNIFGSDGKQKVWRKSNTAMHGKNLRPTIKYGGDNQIVWGCMANSNGGSLHFIVGIMNKYVDLDFIKRNLRQSASKLEISGHFKLPQDNNPKHTADICKLWVLHHCLLLIKTAAQSPDLNPIEHVWDYLQQKVYEHQISNKQDLRKFLVEEWTKINRSFCKKIDPIHTK